MKISPVYYVAAAALIALACLGLWQHWHASGAIRNASPILVSGATASFWSSERNQKAFAFENNEGSTVWLLKTDLVLALPGNREFRVHCAWSGNTCPQIKAMSQRGPIDAVVLPTEFSPHFWLIEAKAGGKVLANEQDQRRELRSKLNRDRNLSLSTMVVAFLALWWVRWLGQPASAAPRVR